MFVQVIELKNIDRPQEEDRNIIENWLCSLKYNGQILSNNFILKTEHGYDVCVATPKGDSLEPCYDNIFVKRDRDLIRKHFSIAARSLGKSINGKEYCACTQRTAVEMQTFDEDTDSLFTCCSCGKPIALYELPYFGRSNDYLYILNWQDSYRAMHMLWMNSLNDKIFGKQLVKANSELNKIGREIAKELSEKAGLKIYYNMFDDLTGKVKYVTAKGKTVRKCPNCGKPMTYTKFSDNYEIFVCDDCKLSSDLPK